MAKKITEILIDDIDGTEIPDGTGETVHFSFEGTDYEIDLTAEHAEELRAALSPYLAVARKRTGASGRGGRGAAARQKNHIDVAAARAWLREQGHSVSDRGRIPANLLEKYTSAV